MRFCTGKPGLKAAGETWTRSNDVLVLDAESVKTYSPVWGLAHLLDSSSRTEGVTEGVLCFSAASPE